MLIIKKILRAAGLIILIIIILMTFVQREYIFTSDNVTSLKDGWFYNNQSITLNRQLNIDGNTPYTITRSLPKAAYDEYLLLRSSLSSIWVTVDGEPIYSAIYEPTELNKLNVSLWHLVKMPNEGQQLAITYKSPYKSMNGLLNDVIYGHKGDLLFYILEIYGKPFILDLLIMFLGLLMILIAIVHPQKIHSNLGFIGLFSLMVSAWLISESRMLQFFTGSQMILGSLAYISLALIPVPLIGYIKNIVSKSNYKMIHLLLTITCINLLFIITMQITHLKDFYETVVFTHIMMAVFMFIIVVILHYEIKIKQNKEAKHFLVSLTVLFVFAAFGLFLFYNHRTTFLTLCVRLGLLIFITMLGLDSFKQLLNLIKRSYETEFYKKLAFKDQLTNGPNRTAFEEDLDKAFHDQNHRHNLRLIILDMNQLKRINDDFGHVIGDEAIKKAYDLIHLHFSPLGQTYRIGGDEFACIITQDINNCYETLHSSFSLRVEKENENLPYHFGIAFGSVKYDISLDLAINQFIHRADINMYEQKKIVF